MEGLIIEFGICIGIIGLQADADLAAGGNIGGEIPHAEGDIVPDIGLSADGVSHLDPELGLPVENGPGPDLGGSIGAFEIDLQEEGGDFVGADIEGELIGGVA